MCTCTTTEQQDQLLTADEVATILRVHVTTVCRLAKANRFPGAFRVGQGEVSARGLRIPQSGVDAFRRSTQIGAVEPIEQVAS